MQKMPSTSKNIYQKEEKQTLTPNTLTQKEEKSLTIAIPLAEGKLALHFGHCQEFALIEVDRETKKIIDKKLVPAPPHQPGLLPPWLAKQGANLIIAGGMGSRAQNLFAEHKIEVLVGAPADTPEDIVTSYLDGELKTGENICDH